MRPADPRARDEETIDVEELAVLEGLKPGMRLTMLAEEVAAIAERVERVGLVARVAAETDRYLASGPKPWARMYVARTAQQADLLRDVEARSRSGAAAKRRRESIELGLGLGYPRCCAEAFVERAERYARVQAASHLRDLIPRRLAERLELPAWLARALGVVPASRPGTRLTAQELSVTRRGVEDYLIAHEAWCARPDARLNNLLFRQRARLISHTPCVYDCGPSVRYADAVAAAIRERRPRAYERIRSLVSSTVVIAPTNARAIVECDATRRVIRAHAPSAPKGPVGTDEQMALDARLAERCLGARIAPTGLLEMPDVWPRPVVLEFTWPD